MSVATMYNNSHGNNNTLSQDSERKRKSLEKDLTTSSDALEKHVEDELADETKERLALKRSLPQKKSPSEISDL